MGPLDDGAGTWRANHRPDTRYCTCGYTALGQRRVANVEPGLELDYLQVGIGIPITFRPLPTYLLHIHPIRAYIYDHAHPSSLLGPWPFQCVTEPRAVCTDRVAQLPVKPRVTHRSRNAFHVLT